MFISNPCKPKKCIVYPMCKNLCDKKIIHMKKLKRRITVLLPFSQTFAFLTILCIGLVFILHSSKYAILLFNSIVVIGVIFQGICLKYILQLKSEMKKDPCLKTEKIINSE